MAETSEKSSIKTEESQPLLSKQSSVNANLSERKSIVWKDVVATVPMKGNKSDKEEMRKTVIKGVSGVALPGEVLAIMGGSGAGKTTLMNVLAHLDTRGVESTGTLRVNGEQLTKTEMRKISAYVQQVDVFVGTLTVREQLTFSAFLRMGNSTNKSEKLERVEEVIKEMNLIDCQNTLIGIPNRMKGISIGEKKRLAFACEVLTDPLILFCDEPTSGLDAFMAAQVVSALRLMAEKGKTIITVIHQPSSTVFNMFHQVCFMANGRPAYHGAVSKLCAFFESLGPEFRVPESYNPADHVISKLSMSTEKKDEDTKRIEYITDRYNQSELGLVLTDKIANELKVKEETTKRDSDKAKQDYAVSFLTQIMVLFKRSFLTTLRDPRLLKVRFAQVVLTAAIIAMVNWNTKVKGATIQNLEGVLYNTVRDMNFLFLFPSINVITSELPIFFRENKARIYSTSAYYWAKSMAEFPQYTAFPILYSIIVYWSTGLVRDAGKFAIFTAISTIFTHSAVSIAYAGACIFIDEGTTVTYMPMLILPMLIFGGFYINPEKIPQWMKPVSHLSWFKYGFEAMQINQWKDIGDGDIDGCKRDTLTGLLPTDNFCPAGNGTDILTRRNMDTTSGALALCMFILIVMLVFFRLVGLGALILRARNAK